MVDVSLSLHWVDFAVFAVFLLANIAIGLYQTIKPTATQDNDKGVENYFLGGRKMRWLPTTISLVMSFLSANIVLGGPAQVYYQGSEYSMLSVGFVLGNIQAAIFFVPLLYPLRLSSSSEVTVQGKGLSNF